MMDVVILDTETTGLDALQHKLIAVGCKVLDMESDSVLRETEVLTIENKDEKTLVAEFLQLFSELTNPLVVGYNVRGFDMPFIVVRGLKYDLPISKLLGAPSIDLMQLVSRHCLINGTRTKLHTIAEYLGLENGDETDGSQMPRFYEEGNFKAIAEHCRYDVELTSELYLKLKPLCLHYLNLKKWRDG